VNLLLAVVVDIAVLLPKCRLALMVMREMVSKLTSSWLGHFICGSGTSLCIDRIGLKISLLLHL